MGSLNNAQIIKQYLDSKGLSWRQRGDEATLNCPFCDDTERKLSINLTKGVYQCFHRNTCGVSGLFSDFQRRFGDNATPLKRDDSFASDNKIVYKLPDQDKINTLYVNQQSVLEYLLKRGFSIDTIRHFRIGADEGIVKLPFFKGDTLINIKYRAIDSKKMWNEKDAGQILFNRENIYDSQLLICEGEYDAMAFYQLGFDAVSVPNGAGNLQWIENEWDYLETFESIIICMDNDNAGQAVVNKIAERLGEWRCRNLILPYKDANECLLKGVTHEQMVSYFDMAEEFRPKTIASPSDFTESVQKLFAKGTSTFGTKTAWAELDNILKGWRLGELTIWSGRNGAGKSTILNQHFLDMADKNVKTCIFSGEMSPDRYLKWAVIQKTGNNSPHPNTIETALREMSAHVYILNSSQGIEPEILLSTFEYAARRYAVQHFIVDSLMKVRLGSDDDYGKQKDFVSSLSDFSKKHGAHVHLVAHPRKTGSDSDEPGKVDIKGSSHITDLADNVIIMYRPEQEQKEKAIKKGKAVSDTQLYVKKNREFGIEGKVHLYFNEHTKRFSD